MQPKHALTHRCTHSLARTHARTRPVPNLECPKFGRPYEAQLWAIFDSNKRLVTYGDYYAAAKKLPPGDYEIRLQVRMQRMV